jgi:hypothetical protein
LEIRFWDLGQVDLLEDFIYFRTRTWFPEKNSREDLMLFRNTRWVEGGIEELSADDYRLARAEKKVPSYFLDV